LQEGVILDPTQSCNGLTGCQKHVMSPNAKLNYATPTSSSFVFTTEDGCWTSETRINCVSLPQVYFLSAISSEIQLKVFPTIARTLF